MAFTEVVSMMSSPGEVIELSNSQPIDSNFAIVNTDLDESDVKVWGYLLFCIYLPFPVQEQAVFFNVPCYNRTHVIFHPFSVISGLNIVVRFYTGENTVPQSLTLYVE